MLLVSTAATAHEYWLLPDTFVAAVGEPVAIAHRVGTGWPGETLPRVPPRIARFDLVDAGGRRAVEGSAGDDPAGITALRRPGLSQVAYRSRPTTITLDAALFESYLRDEGLDDVAAWRAAHGETGGPGREMFSRNAKTLIGAPGSSKRAAGETSWRWPVGLDLELVAETDPRGLVGGGPFTVRLLHHGKPLAGALVKAFPKDGNERKLEARSDSDGRVRFQLPEGGVWLVNAVHMVDAPAGADARWESLWSSLTFEAGAGR
ncbi:MAG: DUF4198 domain-containing protein [Caldimonas sp.]